ncbi:MAG: electron transport complex subunit RsxC [Bacteroidales bacterium]|jgi:electron transport complex protein RnfC|nr:electron transport complex subunit RsxC [Bacteroidales bacterium]MCI2122476.1 electron transport complex subunit RsxC [Bacteroidales bacterium]MCI2146258.1 electron transport complex subunit RsxC [Bacteroidales bacterium]
MEKTFRLGGIHPQDNKLTSEAPVEIFPILPKVYISMAQSLGAPATPVVTKGEKVKVGQVIGKPSAFISGFVHASVSGTVTDVVPMADLAGRKVMHVVIDVEGDEWLPEIDRSKTVIRAIKASREEIIEKIKNAGVVGLGGAGFPTWIKLSPPPGKKAEFLIINGSECEPYVTADDRSMREQPEEIFIGGEIMLKALGIAKGFVGIEDNKKAAIAKMKESAKHYPHFEVVVLKRKYPEGGEKQIINAITGRRVPSLGLPIDTGCVVQNVGTALAVYDAVQKNKPLVESVITVTGKCIAQQRNFVMRVGTSFAQILDAIGGLPVEAAKFISGGPMMGKAVANVNASVLKGTSAFLLLTEKETKREPESACIRCSKCVQVCPMGLEPYLLYKLSKNGRGIAELERNDIQDCIECGCCLYSCPAHIPLLDVIRIGKSTALKDIKSRAAKK